MTAPRILVVRLGAMGDVIHALPAVASLKNTFPGARITWVVEPRWAPLLEANPFVDRVTPLRRGTARGILESWREIRTERYDFAVDFQGLIKSAVTAACARPARIFGFHRTQARERAAALFYSDEVSSASGARGGPQPRPGGRRRRHRRAARVSAAPRRPRRSLAARRFRAGFPPRRLAGQAVAAGLLRRFGGAPAHRSGDGAGSRWTPIRGRRVGPGRRRQPHIPRGCPG